MHDELTVQDGLVFKGNSVVIPKSLRTDMKLKIHSSHLGIEACLRRARKCIYCPGMSAEMTLYISACETFREFDSTTHAKETLMSHEVPSRPWEKIATDIFTLDGKDYLVTKDYYSNFWEVVSRRTKTLLPTTQSLLLPRTINLESEKKEL